MVESNDYTNHQVLVPLLDETSNNHGISMLPDISEAKESKMSPQEWIDYCKLVRKTRPLYC